MAKEIDAENSGFKSLRVLSALGELGFQSDGEVRLVDLVRATGYTRPTVHRLLSTMKLAGFVTQVPSGPYKLGPMTHLLALHCFGKQDIRRMALPFMKALSDRTGCTVHLGIREGDEVVYVDKQEPVEGIHISSAIGQRRPMQFTAMGKALLAFSPPELLQSVMRSPWTPRTKNSLRCLDDLVEQFPKIRSQGYAIDNEESDLGIRCVAAPISSEGGIAAAAISMTTLSSQVSMHQLQGMGREIAQAAREISTAIGRGQSL